MIREATRRAFDAESLRLAEETELTDTEKLRRLIWEALLVDTPMHRELTDEQWAEERSRNILVAVKDNFDFARRVIR